ncbi:MAG: BREX-6 system BrxE protein [Planctomycetota bacterium]|nr:BREX-6 system BrxE protein [Planctomycetota bacterium]
MEVDVNSANLDHLLTAQFALAWAGEGGDAPRLGWWRTELCCEDGGEDLFKRLLPGSFAWATLQAVRETARRSDTECRGDNHDPDRLISLYRLGFVLDGRAEERLADLKRTARSPQEALPGLKAVIGSGWSRDSFESWVKSHGTPSVVKDPMGVRLRGVPPASFQEVVDNLVAAHRPFPESYPLPHYRMES